MVRRVLIVCIHRLMIVEEVAIEASDGLRSSVYPIMSKILLG